MFTDYFLNLYIDFQIRIHITYYCTSVFISSYFLITLAL